MQTVDAGSGCRAAKRFNNYDPISDMKESKR